MREFEQQGGIAFLLISYTALNEMYYLPFRDLERFWTRASEGGRKSIAYDEIDKAYRIPSRTGGQIPYLIPLQKDLEFRDSLSEN